MNIFNAFITGNLVDEPTVTTFEERTVANFTVACNNSRTKDSKPNYIRCAYWFKTPENPEPGKKTIIDHLTKGKSLSLVANNVKTSTSKSEDGSKEYYNVTFNISRIDLN